MIEYRLHDTTLNVITLNPTTVSDIQTAVLKMGRKAHGSRARALVKLSTAQKNDILRAMADGIVAREQMHPGRRTPRTSRNAEDERLEQGDDRPACCSIQSALQPSPTLVREVADLPDPVGEVLADWTRPNGTAHREERVPIGVIGIIFESRPNVTTDAASLCFKTSNATILRGGSEAHPLEHRLGQCAANQWSEGWPACRQHSTHPLHRPLQRGAHGAHGSVH